MDSSTPKTRKIVNMKNGKIDTETRRSGRSKRDTYRTRTMYLVQKGKEINNITGCNVLVDVVPDWPRGKRWFCKSQHYQDSHQSVNNESINTESAAEVTPVFTPQKQKRAVFDSSSSSEFCGICKVRYQTEEDIESDSHWLNCSKGCSWWVHFRCVGIHYENSIQARKVWTSGPKITTFAKSTCLELNPSAGMQKKKKKFYWKRREKASKLA